MFLRRAIKKNRGDELARLRDEVESLRAEIEDLRTEVDALKAERDRQTYTNEDGERVPMSQVLNEYLYGKEEAGK